MSERGAPAFLRSDNGPEFVSKALLSWIVTQGIGTALIEPGKPWQNGVTESFNGKFRDECLSLEWFRSRAEAKVIIETWRRHYNEVRPHSSLDYLTPNEFVARQKDAAPPHATGQGAALSGPPRPGPLHQPPTSGTCRKQGTPSQANRGSKNPGRSPLFDESLTKTPVVQSSLVPRPALAAPFLPARWGGVGFGSWPCENVSTRLAKWPIPREGNRSRK